jgi:hypothetical protein
MDTLSYFNLKVKKLKTINNRITLRKNFLDEICDKIIISNSRTLVLETFYSKTEAFVDFNYKYFLIYFLIHVIYFFLLGPVINIFLIPFLGIRQLINMKFIGYDGPSIIHIFQWMATGINIIIYFYFTITNKNEKPYFQSLSEFEIIICVIVLFIRILIISIRYGFTHENIMKLRYKKLLKNLEGREYILSGWRDVDASTLDLEIKYSIIRLQIESDFLNYNTMSHLEDYTIENLVSDCVFKDLNLNNHNRKGDFKNSNNNKNDDSIFIPKKIIEFPIIKYKNNNIIGKENNIEMENFKNNDDKNKININEDQSIKKNNSRDIDHKTYSKLIPFLKKIKIIKENNYNPVKFWEEQITHYQINNYEENYNTINNNNYTENRNNENINIDLKKSITLKKLIRDLGKKMGKVKDQSAIIFKKVDSNLQIDEYGLPIYLRKADFELFLINFPGRILTREIILLSKENNKPYFIIFIISLIILHSLIPIFFRIIREEIAIGNTSLEMYIILSTTINTTITFMVSMIFVEIGGNDYSRKLLFLRCLSSMINPDKLRINNAYQSMRYLPLINYFCPKNLKTWFNMRLLALDIGKRYLKKVEFYASIFFAIYAIITGILLLGLFDFLRFLSIKEYPLLYIMGFTQSAITFMVLYRMITLGANVNEYFKIHRSEISSIKFKIFDVINNFEKWKKMKIYFDPYLEKAKDFYYYCVMYHRLKTQDEIKFDINNGINFPNPYNENEFKDYLIKLTEEYSKIMEELELQKEINSLKLLGITLNYELVNLFNSAFVGLFFSIFQKFFQPAKEI